jgi:hypothetical protein
MPGRAHHLADRGGGGAPAAAAAAEAVEREYPWRRARSSSSWARRISSSVCACRHTTPPPGESASPRHGGSLMRSGASGAAPPRRTAHQVQQRRISLAGCGRRASSSERRRNEVGGGKAGARALERRRGANLHAAKLEVRLGPLQDLVDALPPRDSTPQLRPDRFPNDEQPGRATTTLMEPVAGTTSAAKPGACAEQDTGAGQQAGGGLGHRPRHGGLPKVRLRGVPVQVARSRPPCSCAQTSPPRTPQSPPCAPNTAPAQPHTTSHTTPFRTRTWNGPNSTAHPNRTQPARRMLRADRVARPRTWLALFVGATRLEGREVPLLLRRNRLLPRSTSNRIRASFHNCLPTTNIDRKLVDKKATFLK